MLGQNNTDPFAYPNRLASCGNNLTNPGNVNNYIKLQCFQIAPVTNINGTNYIQLGNAGRNILTGPGLVDFDFSVVKNTKITRISESFNVQFRVDVFNLFNRANFNPPVNTMFIIDPTNPDSGDGCCSRVRRAHARLTIWATADAIAAAGALDAGDCTATDFAADAAIFESHLVTTLNSRSGAGVSAPAPGWFNFRRSILSGRFP